MKLAVASKRCVHSKKPIKTFNNKEDKNREDRGNRKEEKCDESSIAKEFHAILKHINNNGMSAKFLSVKILG